MKYVGNVQSQANAEVFAVASGAIGTDKTCIVNSDGTVSVVGNTSINAAVGTAVVFESGVTTWMGVTYDSNSDRIVVVYTDEGNSYYGKAVVGQVTAGNNSISFGTPVVYLSAQTSNSCATFDSSNNKVVVSYVRTSDNAAYSSVATVDPSDNSISFGTAVQFESESSAYVSTTFDSNSNKVVVIYGNAVDEHSGQSRVGTVSGTGISFGTRATFQVCSGGNGIYGTSCAFDSTANKVLILYSNRDDSNKLKVVVSTVSGTDISFGSPVEISGDASETTRNTITFDSTNNRAVVAYTDTGNTNKGTAAVGTVSGTTISFGTPVVFADMQTATDFKGPQITFDASVGKVAVQVQVYDGNTSHGRMYSATVDPSDNSISFDTHVVFDTSEVNGLGITYDSTSEKVVMIWADVGSSNQGTASVAQLSGSVPNLTSENYIGISNAAYADTQTATIQAGGAVNTGQSSLTIGQQYFVQTDGTIGTTAATPSVIAGTAVSATDLIVKG